MIFNPAPSDERGSSLPHNCSAGRAEARQPRANFLLDRLTRTYDRFIEKFADDAEYLCIAAFAAIPVALATGVAFMTGEPFWMLMIPLCGFACYLTAMQSVTMMRDKITERDERIKQINDSALWRLCESRREQCDKLMTENSHLEQDVAHWKAVSFTTRGGVKDDTVAGISRLESKEAAQERSATVVQFPDNGSV